MEDLNFLSSQLLAFLSVKTESGTNIVLIVDGPHLKSSVIVMDNYMQRKPLPDLDNIKIQKVAENVYEGHLFAIDEKDNLIAMNLNYLCGGFAPYIVKNLGKQMGGSIL